MKMSQKQYIYVLQVVAIFISQYEDCKSIAEALNIFKEWNPCLANNSLNFIIDHSLAELQALEETFPGKYCSRPYAIFSLASPIINLCIQLFVGNYCNYV